MVILVAFAQLLSLPLTGVALYRLWRRVASADRWTGRLVTGGLLLRVALGLALFWLSYLPIPITPGLEDDNGIWFFAKDGSGYFRAAWELAESGPTSIATYPSDYAATFFVKILASSILALGNAAPVGLIVNLFAYLLTCLALLSILPARSTATTAAIGALSFSPSLILWTLQPLKDVVFLCLIASFVAVAFAWQKQWRPMGERASTWRRVGSGAGLVALLYGVAGIRWYFALLLLLASIPFFALSWLRVREWRLLLASMLVLAGFVAAFFVGGGAYVPAPLWEVLRGSSRRGLVDLPLSMRDEILNARIGFKKTPGNTDIHTPEEVSAASLSAQNRPPPTAVPAQVSDDESAGGARFRDASMSAKSVSAHASQLMVGLSAMVLPRFAGEALGIFQVGGSRGLWLFAEGDTLFFDAVVLLAFMALTRAVRNGGWRSPVLVLVVFTTAAIGAMLAYTITNFGTLFRHRGMVFIGLVMIPIIVAADGTRRGGASRASAETLLPLDEARLDGDGDPSGR